MNGRLPSFIYSIHAALLLHHTGCWLDRLSLSLIFSLAHEPCHSLSLVRSWFASPCRSCFDGPHPSDLYRYLTLLINFLLAHRGCHFTLLLLFCLPGRSCCYS
ncbi:uncharacterized protein BO80DRAFT_95154 [Aspergillus ibericus CBS 121593]|uniref:Uncharacterized protein n=1 Tax=Aspergillus ibericus CBS 121593 TaxID=1448316 RepID=A0A395H360_9EURO|nr:hypothetical protein BO80DRAFT_95154 [Aspergillus ibericus CBS 121593]RAL00674.1 hypothetical protein BO80DRAFT_95154 [Aspergillus ibericus CBS 121593]